MTASGSAKRTHRRHRLPQRVAARLLLAAMAVAAGTASAQQGRPTIMVATPLHIEPPAQVALPVKLSPLSAVPPGCFIRLRGLPSTAALSDGHSIAPGAWAIPIGALARLEVLLPEGATGQSEISITLVSADGTVLAETKATLVVTPKAAVTAVPAAPAATTTAMRTPAPPLQAEPAGAPLLSADARDRAMRMVKKGDDEMADGGIAQARLLYERAAEAGLAQGAMSLAATYDPSELQRLGARGLKADREEARRWYERARQLGSSEAEFRLRRLGGN